MSGVPVAHFLVDFGAKPLSLDVTDEAPPEVAGFGEAHWAERIEEAYAKGIEEGRRTAEADAAAQLAEQHAAAEQSIAAAREAWTKETGSRMAALIGDAVVEMENRLAEAVELVLRPFLAQAVRAQAIEQLRAVIQDLVGNNPGLSLEVSGPEDLLQAVREYLPPSVAAVSFVANDAVDVQIKAGASLLETRIAAWMKTCEGQVA